MAIWQLTFMLIPENEDFSQYSLNEKSFSLLSNIFPMRKDTSFYDKFWGDEDSSCVGIFYYNDSIDEINVRIDVRDYTVEQLNAIVNFANANHLQIFYNAKKIITTLENLQMILTESDAYQYNSNPRLFLEKKHKLNKKR